MTQDNMQWLIRINIAAAIVYATFAASIIVAEIWIFPKLHALAPPPPQVESAIKEGSEIDALRDIGVLLFEHVTVQARTVNELIDSGLFWIRLHYFGALGLAFVNIALLFRLKRSNP